VVFCIQVIRDILQQYIYENLPEGGNFALSDVLVTVPTDSSHGDYMTSAPLSLAKRLGQNPKEFAEVLVNKLQEKNYDEIKKIEIAGPGFINITLTKEAVRSEIESNEKIQTKYSDKKVLVEHSSPNLFKPFHIGHLMNNFIGETVVRIMKAGGGEVSTTSFPSDVSLGIAKTVYFIQKDLEKKGLHVPHFGETLDEEIKYLGDSYIEGINYYEEHPEEQDKIKQLVARISDPILSDSEEVYKEAKKINIEYFEKIVKSLGSSFDGYIYESMAGFVGTSIIESNIDKPFVESEGAVVYIPDESRKDINTTVFINSQGNPTYAGKDIGLIELKFNRFSPDASIYITDNEQIPHFRTVFAAAEQIDDVWRDRVSKSLHVPHGRMTFKGHKMSSRLGGVPLAEDTIDAVLEEVRARSGEHITHLPQDEQDKLQRDIALSALRIAILRAKPGSNINFDPETSLSFEGDSGPYLLYTHARCASLLDKASAQGLTPAKNTDESITDIERKLMHYKEVLQLVVNEIAPQRLVTYLFELAQEFNGFYNDNTIIDIADKKITQHRLYIVSETKKVLFGALHTLGINAPDRM
jgi:arginyl-tRNA synthetase